ncbi:aminodeoxychorismate/anthranilate synthase component II [Radiobacillus kanasensis]|uniref:anthranilate synthase component II n=1 Tax=Radiobacillus kanasensis TaxID=2844358 RepID=UPI001E4FF8FF|nr:aminodeoxychorismate/anthranilate synthase component II [Radiobacillus kanasensis]UFT99069.1 aminodeoxychorismate/anthranilate synthase component II [Radiobacillus kanasensis]
MILLIDNYDSFTFNLYQYISELGEAVQVIRNDQITIDEIRALHPEAIVLSPGPGTPQEAGICIDVVQKLSGEYPILGICLGHQAIGAAFGGTITHAKQIKHGKTSMLIHKSENLFEYLSQPIEVMRYHSLVIEKNSVPKELTVIATAMDDQEVMAVKHNRLPVYGLQFHPESIGTETGKTILNNFFTTVRKEYSRETVS